jgi:nicotinamidase/pyrazinamidase
MSQASITTLLLIDVQKDFHPGGSLAIPTADEDAGRIAALIRNDPEKIDRIVATMDSHQKLHIANPSFWVPGERNSGEKERPDPFTIISAEDLVNDVWRPRSDLKLPKDMSTVLDPTIFPEIEKVQDEDGNFSISKYCIEYARRLEERGRFQICVWPEHCLIGSSGHGIVAIVLDAVHEWTEKTGRTVEWIMKGQNLLTEMYSVLEAEVSVSTETAFNKNLQASLLQSDRLIVCGQAMSHCVNYTVRDIVNHWPESERSKIELLTDCASAVPGFEAAAQSFQDEMKEAGVRLCKSSDVF